MAKKRPTPETKATKPSPARLSRAGSVGFTFGRLVEAIHSIHSETAAQASRAVNLSLTLRNWLIGCYIDAYELKGKNRAAYGEKLLDSLAIELCRLNVSNSNSRQLYRYLRFYRTYPDIVGTLSPQFRSLLPQGISPGTPKVVTPSPLSALPAETLLNRLSYSHLEQIVDMDDASERSLSATSLHIPCALR